jgi:peptidoglycan/LPS O-acetylase OafA/YrhL
MSFSIYLLQGLVMTSVFSLPPARRLALSSPIGHWAMMTLCAVILLVVSRMTFVYIERPGIRVGKALTKAIGHRMRSVKIGAAEAA